MYRNIEWLEPWDSLCTDRSSFEEELRKELRQGHVLYGKKVAVIGRCYDCDEFLLEVSGFEFRYAVAHLTFSGKEESGNYPKTKAYKGLNDWINRCMIPDNNEFN